MMKIKSIIPAPISPHWVSSGQDRFESSLASSSREMGHGSGFLHSAPAFFYFSLTLLLPLVRLREFLCFF